MFLRKQRAILRILLFDTFHGFTQKSCSRRDISWVLREDQCKWWSTNWFIHLKEKKQCSHNEILKVTSLEHLVNNNNNLLTLLAADPPSSRPEWVLPFLFSCFHHLCLVPTDSFSQSRAGLAPHSPLLADRFQEPLDPGKCPFLCRAQVFWKVVGSYFPLLKRVLWTPRKAVNK